MSSSGKPAANPFSAAAKAAGKQVGRSDAAVSGNATQPGRPERLSARAHRGISVVATEDRLAQISMRRATVFSVIFHVVSPITLALTALLFLLLLSFLLHFNFWDLFKSKSPPADLEFSLVNDTQAEKPETPLFKGNHNQKAGGKRDKSQPLKPLEAPPTSPAKKGAPPQPTEQAVQPKPQEQQQPQPPKPTPKQETAKPNLPKNAIAMPKPPEPSSVASGPVATATNAAAPTSPTQLATIGSPSGDAFAGSGLSSSTLGNPQGGESDTPGVDVVEDVDFGPFMADLERRIKRNWMPPRGQESRKVKLLFYLARDGRVLKIEPSKPSGDEDADRAAIAAVQASAPFMPFPPQVKEDILPVEFTFDYNVLNSKNANRGLKR